MLSNTADGTPGEEVLDNRSFFDALKSIAGNAPLPNVVKFAAEEHGTLGWFSQEYHGEHVVWAYSPNVLVLKIPRKKLTLIVTANSKSLTEAARLEDGNVARSPIALAFLGTTEGTTERDELIDHALIALYFGQRDASAALAHQALGEIPRIGIDTRCHAALLVRATSFA